jgi:hypothetical protein
LRDEGNATIGSYTVKAERDMKFPDRYRRIKLHMMNLHMKRNLRIMLHAYGIFMFSSMAEFEDVRSSNGKFVDCYCCNCLGERIGEERPRPHFCKAITSVCNMTPRCEHTLFFCECFSNFVFNFIFDECQNQAMYLHQVLCEAL